MGPTFFKCFLLGSADSRQAAQTLSLPSLPTCTYARRAFHNRVALTYDLSTSGSGHVEVLSWTICVLSLVLIARVVLPFKLRTQTPAHTRVNDAHPTHALATTSMSKPTGIVVSLIRAVEKCGILRWHPAACTSCYLIVC